ncbi:Cytochrome P450 78A9 like [Actinidia chinensis var. chinensis]|uniref:Cytochrome P450 78A9 like n=1 Tax=Actinidia chinensis var. chinensis TaxID=1590841 RepID=A0A2R6RCJ7_ACTCC|nr:Cytochrome P450 78A9 like [Actinidia chinensis var. chinensis]
MKTDLESLWVFALSSKFKSFTALNLALCVFTTCLVWLVLSLIYWAHPGGPAWGKYRLRKGLNLKFTGKPIPGPRGLPVIGSMNLMAGLAHHKIAAAADKFRAKRLMAFSQGETKVIVTCNHDVAKEILNGSVFTDRPVNETAYSLMFNQAIGFAPHGVYWRTLRRISAVHLFSSKQIKASEAQRFEIADQMVKIFGMRKGEVRVRAALKRASLNNMMCSVFGRKYGLGSSDPETYELGRLVDEGYELLGMVNWSDHLPWLVDLDPQSIRVRCSEIVPKVNRFVSQIIAEHRARPVNSDRDFVDVLLSLQGPEKLSDSDMIAVLWEMIFRGTDTVAVLIEWILARMVLHPDVQSRVHDELDMVVGRARAVAETDITEMVYLPAVVKEVLRLHPPGPLLSWSRLAITDSIVDGHHVPVGTTAMVNMWAIMRDPDVWLDPLEFKPERFVNPTREGEMEVSVFKSDLRMAPFGSGRRVCPGKALGLTTVNFWVASLLHEFEWKPSDQLTDVDLTEVLRLSSEMANPLTAKVRPRRTPALFVS